MSKQFPARLNVDDFSTIDRRHFLRMRGYVRHVVTPDRWQADYQVLDKVSVPDGRLSTRKSFIAENGRSALIDSAA